MRVSVVLVVLANWLDSEDLLDRLALLIARIAILAIKSANLSLLIASVGDHGIEPHEWFWEQLR